jgi:hypothetical protein
VRDRGAAVRCKGVEPTAYDGRPRGPPDGAAAPRRAGKLARLQGEQMLACNKS